MFVAVKTVKHSAAPWHLGAGNGEGDVFAAAGRMRGVPGVGTVLHSICTIHQCNAEEDEANARLIVAAPELLAAAREVVRRCELWAECDNEAGAIVRILSAAIDKAI